MALSGHLDQVLCYCLRANCKKIMQDGVQSTSLLGIYLVCQELVVRLKSFCLPIYQKFV